MVWSYNEMDPTGPSGADARYHGSRRGTASVNLLGGQPTRRNIDADEPFLDITVTNVSGYLGSYNLHSMIRCVSYLLDYNSTCLYHLLVPNLQSSARVEGYSPVYQ